MERRLHRAQQQRGPSDAVSEALLVTVVVGSALAIGAVHAQVQLVISVLALVGGTTAARRLARLPAPAWVLGALGLFSAAQATPLPAHWVGKLSPAAAQVWLGCLSPFRGPILARFSISLDPGASLTEALKWLTYAAVYVMAVQVRQRRGSGWLATLLFGSAALVSLATLLHGAANARELYGLYEPNFTVERWNLGPLLNSNNFAGYANLGIFAGLSVLLSGKPTLPRLPLFAAIGVIATALALSTSRGGIVSALIGGMVVSLWFSRSPGAPNFFRRLVPPIAAVLVLASVFVARQALNGWAAWAPRDIERKVGVWRWSVPLIQEHAWFGVGRGAFESALPRYRGTLLVDWTAVHSHAENFVLQWVTEWGVPVGVTLTVVLLGYLLSLFVGARASRGRFVLLTGLAVLLLQNLADLGLEIPAVAIAATVALAACGRDAVRRGSQVRSPNSRAALLLAAPLGAAWIAAAVWASPLEVERRELSRAYRQLPIHSVEERAGFREALRQSMLRHPAEAHFPLLGALVAYRGRDQGALPWLARALDVAPTDGRVHLVLAELLAAHRSTSQAMLHLRLAALYDETLLGVAAKRAAKWAPTLDLLIEAVPPGLNGQRTLSGACPSVADSSLKLECWRYGAATYPRNSTIQGGLAAAALAALSSRASPCKGDAAPACTAEAEHAARAMAKLEPNSWQAGYFLAKVLSAKGDAKGAANLLAKVCPADTTNQCAGESVTAALATGSSELLVAAAERYAERACIGGVEACALAYDWIGTKLDAADRRMLAVSYYTKAAESDGTAARWLKVGERASGSQMFGLARAAVDRADRSPDASENTRAHSALLRGRIARSTAGQ